MNLNIKICTIYYGANNLPLLKKIKQENSNILQILVLDYNSKIIRLHLLFCKNFQDLLFLIQGNNKVVLCHDLQGTDYAMLRITSTLLVLVSWYMPNCVLITFSHLYLPHSYKVGNNIVIFYLKHLSLREAI